MLLACAVMQMNSTFQPAKGPLFAPGCGFTFNGSTKGKVFLLQNNQTKPNFIFTATLLLMISQRSTTHTNTQQMFACVGLFQSDPLR